MLDLTRLLDQHSYPGALGLILSAFARQPDNQTCGAAAIRHGLLLGGLTIPAASLETLLDIRTHQGTPPHLLRVCMERLGLRVRLLRPDPRQTTTDFLDSLAPQFAAGAFLIPCVRSAEHWVLLGGWREGRAAVVDSFYLRRRPHEVESPGLSFFNLSAEELDALDWRHHVHLVQPGQWRSQYNEWLSARSTLLRQPAMQPVGLPGLVRLATQQFLDDGEYAYRRLALQLRDGPTVQVRVDDPGAEALAVQEEGDALVIRPLAGAIEGLVPPPRLVIRGSSVRAFWLSSA